MLEEARALVAIQAASYEGAAAPVTGSWPQASAMEVEAMAAFLEHKRYAVLATTRPDGRPQAAPIAFGVEDGAFWIATVAGARLRNLRATPYASLVVVEGEGDDHRALRAEGPVTLHEGAAFEAARARLDPQWRRRQGSEPTWARAFIELRPERVFSYDAAAQ